MSEFTANPQQGTQEHKELVAYKQNLIASRWSSQRHNLRRRKNYLTLASDGTRTTKTLSMKPVRRKLPS